MSAYYNENNQFAAAWLRELIKGKLIADGEVDERSIELVRPDDLRGFVQCHFFAGIGGWSYALRLAGWPDDRAVWTGSCPCQPFSVAGRNAGGADPRDLWPLWCDLICECRPPAIFGEQVEAAIAFGWWDRVCDDLENEAYAIAAVDLPAASVGAPHLRHRLWFVAESQGDYSGLCVCRHTETVHELGEGRCGVGGCDCREFHHEFVANANYERPLLGSRHCEQEKGVDTPGRRMADADSGFSHWRPRLEQVGRSTIEGEVTRRGRKHRAQWRIKPGLSLLAYGIPGRVGQCSGFGNAIVPQVAAAFIEAYCDARGLSA